jgi:hypothetical protein
MPDVVTTQGRHLVSRPSTPIYERSPDLDFLDKLESRLNLALFTQNLRVHQYGKATAEEWPINHTPPEIKTKWIEDQVAFNDWFENLPPTPSDDGSMQPSTSSRQTLAMHHPCPEPEHTLPKLAASIQDTISHNNRISTTPQTTSRRRISLLENRTDAATLVTKSCSTVVTKTSTKRRLSDIENAPPTEDQFRRSKRRIAVPRLLSLVSVG